jgi:hypothetical protein
VIVHSLHEGSHAIEAALSQAHGTTALRELFDGRELGPSVLPPARGAFARGDLAELTKIVAGRQAQLANHDPHWQSLNRVLDLLRSTDCSRGQALSALVRTEDGLAAYAHPDMVYFVLVRLDLMRWALSTAREVMADCPHPQFGGCNPSRYKVTKRGVQLAAGKCVRRWTIKVRYVKRIVSGEHLHSGQRSSGGARTVDCSRVHLVQYEAFLDNETGVVDGMFAHLRATQTGARSWPRAAGDPAVASFKKVHSNDISTFVDNAAEVSKMFAGSHFSSFANVLRSEHFDTLCPMPPMTIPVPMAGTAGRAANGDGDRRR